MLPFQQVQSIFENLKQQGAVAPDATLQQFAREANVLTQSDMFNAGDDSAFGLGVKRGSAAINAWLEGTGAPKVAESVLAPVGKLLGNEEVGRQIGHGLPRMAVDVAPITVGSMLAPFTGGTSALAGKALTGALMGAGTYEQTNSYPRAIASGVIGAYMPEGIGKLTQTFGRTGIGQALQGNYLGRLATNVGAGATVGLGADVVDIGLAPDRTLAELGGADYWRAQALMNVPWLPLEAWQARRAEGVTPFGPYAPKARKEAESTLALREQRDAAAALRKQEREAAKLIKLQELEIKTKLGRKDVPEEGTVTKVKLATEEPYSVPDLVEFASKLSVRVPEAMGESLSPMKDFVTTAREEAASAVPRNVEVSDLVGLEPLPLEDVINKRLEDVPTAEVMPAIEEQVAATNAAIVELPDTANVPPVVKETLQQAVASAEAEGQSPVEAVAATVQKSQNKAKKVKDAIVLGEEAAAALAEVQRRFAEQPQVVKKVQLALEKFANDPLHVNEVVTALNEWAKRGVLGEEFTKPRLANLDANLKTATQRTRDAMAAGQKDAGGLKGKKGPRNTLEKVGQEATGAEFDPAARPEMEAAGFTKVMERVAALKDTDATLHANVVASFTNFLDRVDPLSDRGTLEWAGVVHQWLAKREASGGKEGVGMLIKWLDGKAKYIERERARERQNLSDVPAEAMQDKLTNTVLGQHQDDLRTKFEAMRFGKVDIPELPAPGEGFSWGLKPYDATTRQLGPSTLPEHGKIGLAQFKVWAGADDTPLAPHVVDWFKQLVPEAFEAGGKVNVPKLYETLKTLEPQVEVKALGHTADNPALRAANEAHHELETLGYHTDTTMGDDTVDLFDRNGNLVDVEDLPANVQALWQRYTENASQVESANTQYSSIAAKSNQPGYVELLVKLPKDKLQYRAPHFGNEADQLLAHVRGYMDVGPNGERVFHVIEVQSDWAQQRRKLEAEWPEIKDVNKLPNGWEWKQVRDEDFFIHPKGRSSLYIGEQPTKEAFLRIYAYYRESVLRGRTTPSHPLHPAAQDIALKAAVRYAKENGATHIALSDAETAMMTEGHDRAAVALRLLHGDEAQRRLSERGQFETPYTPDGVYAVFTLGPHEGTIVRIDHAFAKDADRNSLVGIAYEAFPNGEGLSYLNETPKVSQAPGMRYNYDRSRWRVTDPTKTGPEKNIGYYPTEAAAREAAGTNAYEVREVPGAMHPTLDKITGTTPTAVDFGTHRSARASEMVSGFKFIDAAGNEITPPRQFTSSLEAEEWAAKNGYKIEILYKPQGSPVFRDATGTPKSSTTAWMWPLDKVPDTLNLSRAPQPWATTGNKSAYVDHPLVTTILYNATKGRPVVDAFGGAGVLSNVVLPHASNVVTNFKPPYEFSMLTRARTETEFLPKLTNAVTQLVSILQQGDVEAAKSFVNSFPDADIQAFLLRNSNFRGNQTHTYTPDTRRPTKLLNYLKGLEEVAKQPNELVSQDGWILLQNARPDQTLLVDPPYVGRNRQETGTTTVAQRLYELETFMRPANEQGVRIVYFDAAEPELMSWATSNGFHVNLLIHPKTGRQEFIAYNFDVAPFDFAKAKTTPTESVLLNLGFTPDDARVYTPRVESLGRVFNYFTGKPITLGLLTNAENVAGIAVKNPIIKQILLNPDMPHAEFVAAHEIFGHHLHQAYEANELPAPLARRYEAAVESLNALSPAERTTFLSSLVRDVLPSDWHGPVIDELARTTGDIREDLANFTGLLSFDLVTKSVLPKWLDYVPQALRGFAVDVVQWGRKLMDGVKAMLLYGRLLGQVEGNVVWEAHQLKRALGEGFVKMAKAEELAKHEFGGMKGVLPGIVKGGTWDAGGMVWEGNRAVGIMADAMFGGLKKTLGENVEPVQHRMERYGKSNDVISRIMRWFTEEGTLGNMMERGAQAVLFASGETTGGRLIVPRDRGPLGRVLQDGKTRRVFGDVLSAQNEFGWTIFELELKDPKAFGEFFKDLTVKQTEDVLESVARMQEVSKRLQQDIIETDRRKVAYKLAMLLRGGTDVRTEELVRLSRDIIDNYAMARKSGRMTFDELVGKGVDKVDAKVAADAERDRMFGEYATKNGLDAETLAKFVGPALNAVERKAAVLAQQPYYVTERRMGRYHVSYREKGWKEDGRASFDTPEQAAAFVRELRGAGTKVNYDGSGYRDMWERFGYKRGDVDHFEAMLTAAEAKELLPVFEELYNSRKIDEGTYQELVAAQKAERAVLSAESVEAALGEVSPKRHLRPGREFLDMPAQHLRYISKLARALTRSETDALLSLEGRDPMLTNDPVAMGAYREIRKNIDNYRTPDTPTGKQITAMNFLYFMGMNVSTGILEATQWPLSLAPKLLEEGAGFVQANTLPIKAMGHVTDFNTTQQWHSGKRVVLPGGREVDLYKLMMSQAEAQGRIGLGLQQDVHDSNGKTLYELSQSALGKNPDGSWYTSMHGGLMHASTLVYGMFTGFNERVALIASMDFLMNKHFKGKKTITNAEFQEMYAKTLQIAGTANSSWGRLGRPTGWFDNEGSWRTFAQATYSLNAFNLGLLSNLYRYWQHGFNGKNYPNLTTAQRSAARKAFAQSITVLWAAAGVLAGTPFAGAALALLDKNSDWEAEKKVREGLAQLGGEEYGSFVADVGTHGLAYAMDMPFDVSQRVAPAGVLGFNQYEGWSPKALLGPTMARYTDYLGAAGNVLKGNPTKAIEGVLPVGFKKLWQLYNNDGDIKSPSGETVLPMNKTEQFGLALGFAPKRLNQTRELMRVAQTAQRVDKERKAQMVTEAEKLYQESGAGVARNYMEQQAQKNFGLTAESLADQVAGRQMSAGGQDPRRLGGVEQGIDLSKYLSTMDLSKLPKQTELDTVLGKGQVMTQLGFPQNFDTSVPNAALVDEFVARGFTIPMAKRLVAMLTSNSEQTLLQNQALLPFLQGAGPDAADTLVP